MSFPKAGRFHLKFYHSAPTTSPCYLSINGVQQNGIVLSEQTPGAALPQWFDYGPFDFPQGDVVLRLTPLRGAHPLIWDIGAAEQQVAAPPPAQPPPPTTTVTPPTPPTTTTATATIDPPPPPAQQKPPPPPPVDDLEVIEGIGPKIAEVLKNAGIRTYKDLAAASAASLKKILTDAGGTKFARNDPTSWPRQAQLLVAGDKVGLKALQDSLRGGRQVP